MLITLIPGSTSRRKDYFSSRIDSGGSPTDSRSGPHRFKRWPPPRVWCGTLLRVALCSIQEPPDTSTIVGYILIIPTPGMLCRTPVFNMLLLDTWFLTLDIRHRYLTCYYLTPETWHLTIDMLSLILDICYHLVLTHLTWYCDTWHLYYIAYSWLSLLWELSMIIILLPDIWYSWTLVLFNSCILEPLKRETPDTILRWSP